ncbi:MAG: cellulase family glycosylhydrolase [Ignavibacteriales bacterium]|nr:cellulase family glycosylhydrolase [Ignavibacteriales bacterium]
MKNLHSLFKIIVLTFFIISNHTLAQGFLRVDGEKIINDVDQNFILKGMGLGGWLVQEGYMLKTGKLDAEYQIRNGISDLVGEEKTNELYNIYWTNYVRKVDIDSLASWGFNSIRLPMHYNKLMTPPFFTYNEDGFEQIDTLLNWCKENKIYLILDLHAAPGGQSAGGIADYNPSFPSLWESELNKDYTVELWKTLAERYANEEWIGGYDLINEPAWELGANAPALRELYVRITNAIREVDTNHIIFIEGNWWATTFDGLVPPWDENMVYSFHKYWNETDQGTINYLTSLRSTHNRPLWLGETGENSNDWFRENVKLMEQNNIGWAWWPHKKIDNISSPLSAVQVNGYQKLLDYWNGNGSRPTETEAYNILKDQFNALKLQNCKIQPEVHKALFQSQPEISQPFKNHEIPGIIFGSDYDIGGQLVGYYDKDYKNTGSGSYNQGWAYRNNGVDIEKCTDNKTNGFNVGWIETGEWLQFTINVLESGEYNFNFRFASTADNGKFMVDLDEQNVVALTEIPNTGDWQNWQTIPIENITLSSGEHKLKIRFFFTGYNFNYLEIIPFMTDINKKTLNPKSYKINQNFPNPFNPSTKLEYYIPELSDVKITVYNSVGQKVLSTINKNIASGGYEYDVDLDNFSSGIYYCKFDAVSVVSNKNYKKTIKMMLLK